MVRIQVPADHSCEKGGKLVGGDIATEDAHNAAEAGLVADDDAAVTHRRSAPPTIRDTGAGGWLNVQTTKVTGTPRLRRASSPGVGSHCEAIFPSGVRMTGKGEYPKCAWSSAYTIS